MMLTLLLIKSYLGRIIQFCIDNWRIVLIALIVGVAFYYKYRYDSTVQAYGIFKANIAQLAVKQQAENATKVATAKAELSLVVQVHDKQIDLIKDEYEKRSNISSITIANLRSQLRNTIASDRYDLPKTPNDSTGTSEEWRVSYTAVAGKYETLKEGCAITTSDYNALRDYADNNCAIFGCE